MTQLVKIPGLTKPDADRRAAELSMDATEPPDIIPESDGTFTVRAMLPDVMEVPGAAPVEDDAGTASVGTPPGQVSQPAGSTFAQKAVNAALTEMETFARRNGATVTETHTPLRERVLEYFRFVNRPDITDPSAEAWSAAFISFVMNLAGATQSQFPKSAGHAKYILFGLSNRIANRLNASVVYFDTGEMAPRIGDLIGFSRTSSVKNRADIEAFLSLPANQQFFASHTNLVIDVSPGSVTAIGGNVSQTIKTTKALTGADGKIVPSDKHFFVLRINM